MTAFTTNMTGTTQLDDSIVLAFAQSYLIALGNNNVMDQLVQYKEDIGAKSVPPQPEFPAGSEYMFLSSASVLRLSLDHPDKDRKIRLSLCLSIL